MQRPKEMELALEVIRNWLPCVSPAERIRFLRDVRDRWCADCGHTEGYACACQIPGAV